MYNSLPQQTAVCPVLPITVNNECLNSDVSKIQNSPGQIAVPGSCEESPPMPLKPVVWFCVERGGNAFAGDWGVLNAEPRFGGKPCMLWVWGAAEPPKLRDAIPASESIWMKNERRLHTGSCKMKSSSLFARFLWRQLHVKNIPEESHGRFKIWNQTTSK